MTLIDQRQDSDRAGCRTTSRRIACPRSLIDSSTAT
jgi:hypothetical protein